MRPTRILAALACAAPIATAAAQLPGLPVLQGAFPAPGLAAGVDLGQGSGRQVIAGALGYAPGSGRFGVTAGIGAFAEDEPGYRKGRVAYGARVALTAVRFADDRVALTPFAGFGSRRPTLANASLAGAPAGAVVDTGSAVQLDEVPLGVAAGWRFGLGASRAMALSLAPAYVLYRRAGAGFDDTRWGMRVAAVAEASLAPRLGVALGAEFGQAATGSEPGPRGVRAGLGVSVSLARR
jgi:hypothetical protein